MTSAALPPSKRLLSSTSWSLRAAARSKSMSAEARAEREKDARIVLAEVEKDIAAMLLEATELYRQDEMAFKLRQMHLVNQSLRESGGSLVVPSSYAEGFVEKAAGATPPTQQ